MCVPIAALPVIMSVAGTAMGVVGQVQQQQAASQQASYQAAVARNNAILATQASDQALQDGSIDAANAGLKTKAVIGQQEAALAANGVAVGSGSALDITQDTQKAGTLDELTDASNAQRKSAYYLAQGMNFNASATLDDARADQSNFLGVAATAIGGAGSVAGKWYDLNNAGVNVLPSFGSSNSTAYSP